MYIQDLSPRCSVSNIYVTSVKEHIFACFANIVMALFIFRSMLIKDTNSARERSEFMFRLLSETSYEGATASNFELLANVASDAID